MLPRLILVFLSVDWPIFSRRRMLAALAESASRHGSTVVAVNRPLCPLSTFHRKPRRTPELFWAPGLVEVAPNLHLYSPKYFLHDGVARRSEITENLNIIALRRSLRALQRRIGLNEPSPIVWYYHPQQGYVTRIYEHSVNIFELYDNLTDVQGQSDKSALAMEQKWRSAVDLFLATSPDLIRRFGSGYRNACLSKNGLSRRDYNALAQQPSNSPQAFKKIPHPRLGFAGVISDRLDWDLIEGMAGARPDWSFVFAGRVTHSRYTALLSSRKNTHYLGEYAQEEIPAIIAQFDLGIMPYLDNGFFRASNPLKFYEYCAAGIASVSSPMALVGEFPSSIAAICGNTLAEWVTAVERLLRTQNDATRELCRSTAREYLWEDITDGLLATINEYQESSLDERGISPQAAGRRSFTIIEPKEPPLCG